MTSSFSSMLLIGLLETGFQRSPIYNIFTLLFSELITYSLYILKIISKLDVQTRERERLTGLVMGEVMLQRIVKEVQMRLMEETFLDGQEELLRNRSTSQHVSVYQCLQLKFLPLCQAKQVSHLYKIHIQNSHTKYRQNPYKQISNSFNF